MANSASSKKRARQSVTRRTRNTAQRARLRTYVKKVIAAVEGGDAQVAKEAYQVVVPMIDSAASKGLIHKNKAARSKSRLNARVRALALQAAA